ncbi:ELMO domain-containing protein A [Zostera marina]|uniref:ELMO domain-containing protein A n=1 Tax=Zostera marina TaxID=29655 RepID=A0A0K9PHS5_ZOSMR|nr:ELMO domain-containing protein A [Zostera marina]
MVSRLIFLLLIYKYETGVIGVIGASQGGSSQVGTGTQGERNKDQRWPQHRDRVALQWSEKKKKGSMAGQEGSFMAVRRIQHGIDRGRGFHSSPADLVNGSATWIGRGFSCVCVQKRDGDARISFELTPFQEECLNRLQRRIEVCYDGLKTEHQEALMDLWRISFPEVELLDLISEQWKKMGWQGKDPSTDFRGGGFISLENLLFFANTFPNSYRSLLLKEEGERATWEYPFAVAGVNITFMLIQLLDLQLEKPRTIIGAIFLKLLSENPRTFDILYCITFKMMDQQWLSLRATYMDFNTVMKSTRRQLERELISEDVQRIEDMPSYRLLKR